MEFNSWKSAEQTALRSYRLEFWIPTPLCKEGVQTTQLYPFPAFALCESGVAASLCHRTPQGAGVSIQPSRALNPNNRLASFCP